jgi:hypothetical protein
MTRMVYTCLLRTTPAPPDFRQKYAFGAQGNGPARSEPSAIGEEEGGQEAMSQDQSCDGQAPQSEASVNPAGGTHNPLFLIEINWLVPLIVESLP